MTAGALLAGFAFRRVIEIEFTQFHDEWLKDGKPVGGAGSRRARRFGIATSPPSRWYSTGCSSHPAGRRDHQTRNASSRGSDG